jgi:xylan 1,4-beta-xylosidase
VSAASAQVRLQIKNLPAKNRVLVERYSVDANRSNAFALWQAIGSPQQPTPEQYDNLEAAGQLQSEGSPEWRSLEQGSLTLQFLQPRQGLSLFRISW